mmetsp:Transcript_49011/g.131554  ORF Transcript_49011/g.131554 Transcript_49011/m.131554 type:complete len:438 (-) Transcript_49011:233-1546(-)
MDRGSSVGVASVAAAVPPWPASEKRRRVETGGDSRPGRQLHPQLHPNLQESPSAARPVPNLHPHPPSEQSQQQHQQQQQPPQRSVASARMVCKVTYRADCILGKGSFGVVFKAFVSNSQQIVAIKAVKQRLGEINIEDRVLRKLRGLPNIVLLLGAFPTGCGEEHRWNLVLEYLSDTLQRIIKHLRHVALWMELHDVRLYMHQILRGLGVLDRNRIVHRDIKPANLLVDPVTKTLKICDFGTAKELESPKADNQPYVCSRYYRAPELILSSPDYGTPVDLWSAGCVLAEMLVGQPLFPGQDGVDQLGQIVDILGTPTLQELYAMNPNYDRDVVFIQRIEPVPLEKVLRRKAGIETIELLGRLLQYDPTLRVRPVDGMAAALFEPLWQAAPQQRPELFDLSWEELAGCAEAASAEILAARISAVAASRLSGAVGTWTR